MKKAFRHTAVAVVFLFIAPFIRDAVWGQTPPVKTPDLLGRGKKIYEEKCAVCHGARGNGQTPMAKVLAPPPRDFTQPLKNWAVSQGDPVKVFKVVKEGIPSSAMVKFDMPDEDIWALVYTILEFNHS